MILIDTSAWIEFFRKDGDRSVKQAVAAHIEMDEAAYTCPVYFELLSGASPREKRFINETFEFCTRIIFEPEFWEKAAELEQNLRTEGITVPRDDVFVAVVIKESGLPLLCKDKHFNLIRRKIRPAPEIHQFDKSQ